jgi:hypothetical protein
VKDAKTGSVTESTMEKRVDQRRDTSLLQQDFTRVSLVFPDKHEAEGSVVDIGPQGLKVSVKASDAPAIAPQQNDIVEIFFAASFLRVVCRCIHSVVGQDGSLVMGFYVFDPDDQVRLRIVLHKMG